MKFKQFLLGLIIGLSVIGISAYALSVFTLSQGGTNASSYSIPRTLLYYDGTRFVSTSTSPLYVDSIVATSTKNNILPYASSTSLTSSSYSTFGGFNSTASSTVGSTFNLPSLSNGCLNISSGVVGSTGTGCVSGTVTSVGLLLPTFFKITNSPVTTSGTLTGSMAQPANSILTTDSAGTNIIATGTQLTVGNLLATTTATSTFSGNLQVGARMGTGGLSNPYILVSSTTPVYPYAIEYVGDVGGDLNDFISFNAFNNNSGPCASSDLTVNNNIANITAAYGDLGHTSSNYTGVGCPAITTPLTGVKQSSTYLFDPTGNISFLIGSTSPSSYFNWFTGGYASTNEVMRLTNAGILAVGTTTPSPNARLNIATTTTPQIALNGNPTDSAFTLRSIGNLFSISTSSPTTYATNTQDVLSISGLGNGTTTLVGLNINGFATSTSNVGFNITNGCYAINKICVGGGSGSGTVTSVATGNGLTGGTITTTGTLSINASQLSTNGLVVWNGTNFVSTTSQVTVGSLLATSTALNSIFNNNAVAIGTSTPSTNAILTIATTSTPQLALSSGAGDPLWTFRAGTGNLYIGTTTNTTAGLPAGNDATNTPAAITVLKSGFVGLGIDVPTTLLHMFKASGNIQNKTVNGGTGKAALIFERQNSVGGTSNMYVGVESTAAATFVGTMANSSVIGTDYPFTLHLATNSIVGASMTPQQNFAVGTTSAGNMFEVSTTSASTNFAPQISISDNSAAANKKHWTLESKLGAFYISTSTDLYATSTNAALWIDVNGQIYAPDTITNAAAETGAWCYNALSQLIRTSAVCSVSALKFKTDVQPLDVGLADLLKIEPVSYYKKNPLDAQDSHRQMGVIADWVAKNPKLAEMLVTYDANGDFHGFRYDAFTSLLTKSIQELNAKVENLKLGVVEVKRSAEENFQWLAIGLLVIWNLALTFRKRK